MPAADVTSGAGGPRPVALVTGGARRIGRTVALQLADAGWDVAVHFRGSEHAALETCGELRARGARAEALRAELDDEVQVRELVPQALQRFGRLDALVNNASLFEHDTALTIDSARALLHYRINTVAPVLLAQALHAHLRARSARGCAVNLLDQKLWNPNPDHLSYTLSKAALREANTLLAQALAPELRVVAVAPGLTLGSPLIDAGRLREVQASGPLGLGPRAEDVADAVLFALRNGALTGCELLVDAGQHLRPSPRDFAFD
ncbi:MAG: SDR family NAD(P)-dependent oxidoreductase [Betaproteobacteria bacterium]|nr:SDR family NAD(P)-dependent oxidoreductase [Betaproteobacteria bacterium]